MTQKIMLLVLISFIFYISGVNFVMASPNSQSFSEMTFSIEMLPWENVKPLIPLETNFKVIDYETGMHFNVQVRAGKNHADVQPLSRKDTLIMKKIYNGKWSWNRRAIITIINGRMIAASMNGMPHGAGALRNGFPGHFCIHFYKSSTHTSRNVDFAHQLMVYKAADYLDHYLLTLDTASILEVFLVAFNQKDKQLLASVIDNPAQFKELIAEFKYVYKIDKTLENSKKEKGIFVTERSNYFDYFDRHFRKQSKKVNIIFTRDSLFEQWKIQSIEPNK